jgi:hypothetical protein
MSSIAVRLLHAFPTADPFQLEFRQEIIAAASSVTRHLLQLPPQLTTQLEYCPTLRMTGKPLNPEFGCIVSNYMAYLVIWEDDASCGAVSYSLTFPRTNATRQMQTMTTYFSH